MFQDLGAASVLLAKVAAGKGIPCDDIDGQWVFERAKEGDKCCQQAIEQMTDILGMGIANICYVINPEIVVLGGGIMSQREYLMPGIEAGLDKYPTHYNIRTRV